MNKKEIRHKFRTVCLIRDNYSCCMCGVSNVELDVHHITDRHDMPNGGYVKENGISLCNLCHIKAEECHRTGVSVLGYSPKELYDRINSSYEMAVVSSKAR